MQLKLIIVPSNSWLRNTSKQVYSYFKFDKEFYKFKSSADSLELGEIRLVQQIPESQVDVQALQFEHCAPKLSSFRVAYRLVESKFELKCLGWTSRRER